MDGRRMRVWLCALGLGLATPGCGDDTSTPAGTGGAGGAMATGGSGGAVATGGVGGNAGTSGSGGTSGTGGSSGTSGMGGGAGSGGTGNAGVDPEIQKAAADAACENLVACVGSIGLEDCTAMAISTFEELITLGCDELYLTQLQCQAAADCAEFSTIPGPCDFEIAQVLECRTLVGL